MITRSRLLTLEAICALTVAGLALRTLRFSQLATFAGRPDTSDRSQGDPGPSADIRSLAIGRAIERGAQWLPWHSTCLVKAIAGRLLLLRRGMPSTLVIGVTATRGRVGAHAWLLAGGGAICGGREAADFRPIIGFRGGAG